jgi:glycosidase
MTLRMPTSLVPRASAIAAALCTLLLAGPALAQAPVVEKVDPPNWWARHSINPVRILVRGQNLTGARLACTRVTCARVKVSESGTWLFADVTIPPGLAPGSYPLTLSTDQGSTEVPFTVSPRLARAGRFQGFGPNDVMYLLMPDRFANGDTANDEPEISRGILDRSNLRRWHGGDLAGVRQRLPYLKELGITAIWMNPIYDNPNHLDTLEVYDRQPTTAYHGYHAIDYYAVDERFGDMESLRALVDEAHGHGIKVILDMVANHTGAWHAWVKDSPTPTWFNGTQAKHLNNNWQVWTLADPHSPPAVRQPTLDGWFIDLLPDLNQDDPEVARYINQNTLWWIEMSGIDGIRQDTWPYVPRRFWSQWMTAIKREYPTVRVVGEVFDGDPSLVAFFQGGRARYDGIDTRVDALFDFPLYFTIRNAFAQGKHLREVAQMLSRDHLYPAPQRLVTFLGLHDVSRFMGEQGATADGLRLAFTFLLTARGTPLVYYGDEIAMPGGGDPDNRRDFPGGWPGDPQSAFDSAGRSAEQQATFRHVRDLLKLRASRADLRTGTMTNLHIAEQSWVYRRGRSMVALNNDTKPVDVRVPAPTWSVGEAALGGCPAPRTEGGELVMTIPARSGCVY